MPVSETAYIREARAMEPYGFTLTIDAPAIAETAVPGQFVHVDCGGDTLLRRPFGICSVEGMQVRLCCEKKGRGTELLYQLQPGGLISVLGPLGRGFDLSGGRILLAGGGLGTSPLLFAARRCSADAVLGYRTAERELLSEDFRAVCGTVDVCTDDGTLGRRAFVDAVVRERLQEKDYARVLTCGPAVMMRAVAAVCRELGVPCQVSLEARMGCGVGACLVCACRDTDGHYRRACKDGPVFNAEEVDWDA